MALFMWNYKEQQLFRCVILAIFFIIPYVIVILLISRNNQEIFQKNIFLSQMNVPMNCIWPDISNWVYNILIFKWHNFKFSRQCIPSINSMPYVYLVHFFFFFEAGVKTRSRFLSSLIIILQLLVSLFFCSLLLPSHSFICIISFFVLTLVLVYFSLLSCFRYSII